MRWIAQSELLLEEAEHYIVMACLLPLKSECSSAAAALHWLTVIMVSECSLLVLFPDDPATGSWGRGSRLAFNTAVQHHIPVFAVTAIPPLGTRQFQVEASSLFGVIDGHWVVPQGVEVRGDQEACDDQPA